MEVVIDKYVVESYGAGSGHLLTNDFTYHHYQVCKSPQDINILYIIP